KIVTRAQDEEREITDQDDVGPGSGDGNHVLPEDLEPALLSGGEPRVVFAFSVSERFRIEIEADSRVVAIAAHPCARKLKRPAEVLPEVNGISCSQIMINRDDPIDVALRALDGAL